ncbi:MAG: HAD hydrolase family protein [Erysipelotrichaceae bacterium]
MKKTTYFDKDEKELAESLEKENWISELDTKEKKQYEENAIYSIAKQNQINCYFGGSRDILLDPVNAFVEEAHAFFNEDIPVLATYQNELIDKILVYGPINYSYNEFKSIEGISVFPSMSTYADIVSQDVSKYAGIDKLLEHFNLPKEYCAFGDAQNDIEMIKHAKLSVAMGNGDELLKSQADYIADDINQDGIAKMLKQLNYI